jgi:hypothetical protein
VDWSYFRGQTAQRSTDPGGEVRGEMDVGVLTLFGGGGGERGRQLYRIDIDDRILRTERFAFAGAQARLSSRLSLAARAEERRHRYDPHGEAGDDVRLLDRDVRDATLTARFRITSLTTLVARSQLTDETFLLPPSLAATRSYRHLVGFELGRKAVISGRLLAGVRDLPAGTSGVLPAYRGAAVLADLAYPFTPRARVTLAAQRDLVATAAGITSGADARERNAYVHSSVRGGVEGELPLRLFGRLLVGRERARYLLPFEERGALVGRVDDLTSVGGALLRQFGDAVRVGVAVSRDVRDSSLEGRGYVRWVYGLSAELAP